MTKLSGCKLRPHHLLCLQFFEGKGYSGKFANEMKNFVLLCESENPEVTLTRGYDMLCEACPNRLDKSCAAVGKAEAYDEKCLEISGLEYGVRSRVKSLEKLAKTKIILSGRLGEVCGDCRWCDLCVEKAEKSRKIKKQI